MSDELRDYSGGGKILIHAEQGAGDVMLMLRYVPLFSPDQIVLEVLPPLVTLAQTLFPDVKVIKWGDEIPADVTSQEPMMSLPLHFGTTIETIPEPMSAECVARVPIAPACACDRLHVGLAWAGSRTFVNDADRSAPVGAFAPLVAIPGVHWIGLQTGERADEYNFEETQTLEPFLATASIIRTLDFVVSVDTAVAHLTGLLGVPLHLITQSMPYWLWMLKRDDSPWYPSAKLWRRSAKRAWPVVLEELERDIRTRVRHREAIT